MSTDDQDLHQRMTAMENELRLLKMGSVSNESAPMSPKSPKSNIKKIKKSRAPTEYNKYMSNYLLTQKEKLGVDFKHKVAFGEAAKSWTSLKNNKES